MRSMPESVQEVHRRLEAERGPRDPPSQLFPPARPDQIAALESDLEAELPASYREFLEVSDGWIGFWFGLTLLGASGPAREALEAAISSATEAGVPTEILGWSVVLGANVDEDLYVVFDPAERAAGGEPRIQVWSTEDGQLEVFESFAAWLKALTAGDALPRTVPLDLEQQFRPWEEHELLERDGRTEDAPPDGADSEE